MGQQHAPQGRGHSGDGKEGISIGGIPREAGEEEEGVLQLLGGLRMMLPPRWVPVEGLKELSAHFPGRPHVPGARVEFAGSCRGALAALLSFPRISIFTNQAGT